MAPQPRERRLATPSNATGRQGLITENQKLHSKLASVNHELKQLRLDYDEMKQCNAWIKAKCLELQIENDKLLAEIGRLETGVMIMNEATNTDSRPLVFSDERDNAIGSNTETESDDPMVSSSSANGSAARGGQTPDDGSANDRLETNYNVTHNVEISPPRAQLYSDQTGSTGEAMASNASQSISAIVNESEMELFDGVDWKSETIKIEPDLHYLDNSYAQSYALSLGSEYVESTIKTEGGQIEFEAIGQNEAGIIEAANHYKSEGAMVLPENWMSDWGLWPEKTNSDNEKEVQTSEVTSKVEAQRNAHKTSKCSDRLHCDVCSQSCSSQRSLSQHKRIHVVDQGTLLQCNYEGCGKNFNSSSNLSNHKRVHIGQKVFICDYPGCEKSFGRNHHLKRHKITHSGEKPYACCQPDCDERFGRKDHLDQHMRKHNKNT